MKQSTVLMLLLSVLICPCITTKASATELEHGFLVQLEEGRSLQVLPVGVSEVYADAGLYLAEDLKSAEHLSTLAKVSCVEENVTVSLLETPNDTLYRNGSQWNLDDIGISYAWEKGLSGEGVRIGIIDSGIRQTHKDLAGAAILEGYDYLDRDTISEDTVGHGTFVAGMIAAQVNNGLGIGGIAPRAELVPLRCFSAKQSTMDVVVEAIYGAIDDYHCQILNLSLGVDGDYQVLREAIAYAEQQGVIVVAAVGNKGTVDSTSDPIHYPAGYDTVIGVGATDVSHALGGFSQKNESVFVVAPGVQVVSLGYQDDTSYFEGGGTSFATPGITAIVALMKESDPGLTRQGVMDALQKAAVDLGEPGWDSHFGYGLIRIPEVFAVLSADNTRPATPVAGGFSVNIGELSSPPGASLLLCAAAYQQNGRMCGTSIQQMMTAEDGSFPTKSIFLPTTGEAVRIQLFLLNPETLSPMQEAKQILLP